ncbi:MAG: hypothetical protein AAGF28_10475 [Pseudomonadota bacterium]
MTEKTMGMNSSPPTLELDIEYYQSFLDDVDISDDKKQELIETLWSIVVSFVDLGFDIHPLQCSGVKQAGDSHQRDYLPAIRKMIEDAANAELTPLEEALPEGSETP